MNNCQKVRELLPQYLSREIAPAEAEWAGRHLLDCAVCLKEWQAYQSAAGALKELEAVTPLGGWPDYEQQLYQKIRLANTKPSAIRILTRPLFILQSVALLIISFGIGYLVSPILFPRRSPAAPVPVETARQDVTENQALGLRIQPVSEAVCNQLNLCPERGLVVAGVREHSAAETAGLKMGDIIIEINGQPVTATVHLSGPGQLKLKIIRQGVEQIINLSEERR